jgi:DNA processing protein
MAIITSLATDERTARTVLATACAPGDALTGRLLAAVGAIETLQILTGGGPAPGVDAVQSEVWRQRVAASLKVSTAAKALEDTADLGLRVIVPGDQEWPKGLGDLGDREPIMLWGMGDIGLMATKLSAMVTLTGMRAATAYGETVASELSADLCHHGRVVVAGGGYGIDQAVHSAALVARGKTIAVLASGLDRPHPPGNETLLRRMGQDGLLLSELPPGAVPTRLRFVARHRILAALSGATVVVEAAARSGALHSARQAAALGRPVGAVPGPVTSAASTGTHTLLRDAIADIVTSARDVEDLLEPPAPADDLGRGLPGRLERISSRQGVRSL